MKYTATASKSGITVNLDATTLTGAKREASAWISFGGGDVTIFVDGVPIATRWFWQELNLFGWGKWVVSA